MKSQFLPSSDLKLCNSCKYLWYCSKECQKEDWIGFHKHKECDFYQKLTSSANQALRESFEDIRAGNCAFLIRAFLLIKAKPAVVKQDVTLFNGGKRTWLSLMDNDGINEKFTPMLHNTITRLQSVNPVIFADRGSQVLMLSLYHMVRINSHVINHRTEIFPDGQGLSIQVSVLNHSCRPNVSTVFKGNRLEIRAIKDIRPGDEVTFAYIELLHSKAERHKLIKEMWEFVCNCERCQEGDLPAELEDLEKIKEMNHHIQSLNMFVQAKEYVSHLAKVLHLREIYEGPYHHTLTDDMFTAVQGRIKCSNEYTEQEKGSMRLVIDKLVKAIAVTHGGDHEMFGKAVQFESEFRSRH